MRARLTVCEAPSPERRRVLLAGGALFGAAFLPKIARAAGVRDPRFITIILRGALDGLSAVAPVGDPDYVGLHGPLALSPTGDHAAIPLDSFFALNPAMTNFARLYRDKQAAVVHAVATNYRERSHFDGQDVLESGQPGPGRVDSGWLNRAIDALPKGDKAINGRAGLGVGTMTPLVMRGPAKIAGWAPTQMAPAGDDLAQRVMQLYQDTDPVLANALAQGLDLEKIAGREKPGQPQGGGEAAYMRRVAEGAVRLVADEKGPRVAALAFDGWDTHANEGGATGRLSMLLAGLDGAIEAFEKGLGAAWKDTIIVAVTEFGRTARVNGTTGTDHGTGTVAFLAGGAVKGGRVVADWPGLKDAQLWQNRDLKPTTDLRAVLKGLLADHLGLSASVLAQKVFPESAGVTPIKDLVG